MDGMMVLAKTAKGVDEVKTRANGLPQKLRTLLITVDGQKTVGSLLERFGALGDIEAGLEELMAKGMVEAFTVTDPGVLTPQAASAALAAAQREESYAEAVSSLCRLLYDYIGPEADMITGPLEKAGSRAEFVLASERALLAARGRAGAKKAERVAEMVAFILSRYLPE